MLSNILLVAALLANVPAPAADLSDNGVCVNVLKTDGKVDRYELSGKPEIFFSGSRLSVGAASYNLSDVQRLEYGTGAKGVKTEADWTGEAQRAIFIYRNDGDFHAFLQSQVKSLRHDIADTLQVSTADSLYKIPLPAIDSIGIHAFPTEYNARVIKLAPYEPYVESVSVQGQTIKFRKNLPNRMKIKKGDILFSETFNETFPDGFAGRVVSTDGYDCNTEMVGLDEIYERVILFAHFAPAEEEAPLKSVNKPAPPLASDDGPQRTASFDLKDLKFSVSRGPLSASLDIDLNPGFNVSAVKASPKDKSMIVVDVSMEASAEVEVTLKASGESPKYYGPSLTPVAKFVIPACPIFAIGLDITPFLQFSAEGSISASAKATSFVGMHMTYCDGHASCTPKVNAGLTTKVGNAKAEGKIFAGAQIIPSVQLTGGIWKVGPEFEIGPAATLTLDVNPQGVVSSSYDVIKDSKLTLSVEGKLNIIMLALGWRIGATELPSFPFTLASKDFFFLPLFTAPSIDPKKKDDVGVQYTASRDLLFPVDVGIDINHGATKFKDYSDGPHADGDEIVFGKFSGFEVGEKYTAIPTADLFGIHFLATPRTDFVIEGSGVKTGNANGITKSTATIWGNIFDVDKYQTYGLRYSEAGKDNWTVVNNPGMDSSKKFKAELQNLTPNTGYRYQAFLIIDSNTSFYGEEKYFTTGTGGYTPEFKNPGNYRFDWRMTGSVSRPSRSHGYFERKGYIQYIYDYDEESGDYSDHYTRIDDSGHYIDRSVDGKTWDDGDGAGPHTELSRTYYKECQEGIREEKRIAESLGYQCFEDGLGELGYFVQTIIHRLCQSGYDDKTKRDRYLKDHLLGTDTICGVECNVYNFFLIGYNVNIWVDPKTSLTLRLESEDRVFEVTHYEIDGYNFNNK